MLQCANQANIPWNFIAYCRDTRTAEHLTVLNGFKTFNVTPQINYIPTIIFDNVYNQKYQDDAERNFFNTACSLFKIKPVECK